MISGEKEKIHVLLNPDNYFGKYEGRMGPAILFLIVSAAPFLIWVVLLMSVIPFKFMITFEVLWTALAALHILGKGKEKYQQYLRETGGGIKNEDGTLKDDGAYISANDLMRISRITKDGLIEYMDGRIGYIVSGFCSTYLNDREFTSAMKDFLAQLRGYEFDIYTHLVVDEYRLQDNLSNLKVYTDKEMMKERMVLYQEQDAYSQANSELYRISFVITGYKYDWKILRQKLEYLITSEASNVFKHICICNDEGVNDILSRDVCANVDVLKMLVKKYENDEYFNSEVLFYGDNIPEQYQVKRDQVQLDKRRVVVSK